MFALRTLLSVIWCKISPVCVLCSMHVAPQHVFVWETCYCRGWMCKRGLSAWQPLACPPSVLWCVSLGSAVGLWCLAESIESADGRSEREKEAGGRERCVVALIWSAILVNTNQGLPAPRGAWVHLPKYPRTTYTLTNACTLSENMIHKTIVHS